MKYFWMSVFILAFSCAPVQPYRVPKQPDYYDAIYQGKSVKEILELSVTPDKTHPGYLSPGKIDPLENIERTYYYKMDQGELFVYISEGKCVKTLFKDIGVEW